jgi:hypothetical protein
MYWNTESYSLKDTVACVGASLKSHTIWCFRKHLEEQAAAGKKLLKCISDDKTATLGKFKALCDEYSASQAAPQRSTATTTGGPADDAHAHLEGRVRMDGVRDAAARLAGEGTAQPHDRMVAELASEAEALRVDASLLSWLGIPDDSGVITLDERESLTAWRAAYAAVPRITPNGVPTLPGRSLYDSVDCVLRFKLEWEA